MTGFAARDNGDLWSGVDSVADETGDSPVASKCTTRIRSARTGVVHRPVGYIVDPHQTVSGGCPDDRKTSLRATLPL